MFKSKQHLLSFKIFLFIGLGLLFLIINRDHQVIAMNNGHVTQNNGDNNHTNFLLQANILREMNIRQARIVQQIFNARNNNASEEIINNLMIQNSQLSQQIAAQQIIVHTSQQQNNRNQSNRRN